MPRDFTLLTQRSIFEKGRLITDAGAGSARPDRHDEHQRRDHSHTDAATSAVANLPADSLIFNGVTQTADTLFAFIEDTASNSIALVQAGDALAGGKVISISFDNLQISIGGKIRAIDIGQTLTGKTMAATSGTSSTQPSGAASTGGSGSGDADSVLERMRRRREAESGGR